MEPKRHWYTGLAILGRTVYRTAGTLRRHRLGFLLPVFVFLLLAAAILWIVNGVAPIAPFVYSLF